MGSTKTTQRKKLLKMRSELSSSQVATASKKVCELLYSSQYWSRLQKVHIYLPIESRNEISTWPLLRKLWADGFVKTYTSIYGEQRALQHVLINKTTKFGADRLGIPMPIQNYSQEATNYDLIVVPVVGFDEKMHRLGYGRGVYDTFLASQPSAKKVGLAYQASKLDSIDNEVHDVILNEIITEVKLYIASR